MRRLRTCGTRQSRSFENIRDAEFSCSSFNNVTTPSSRLAADDTSPTPDQANPPLQNGAAVASNRHMVQKASAWGRKSISCDQTERCCVCRARPMAQQPKARAAPEDGTPGGGGAPVGGAMPAANAADRSCHNLGAAPPVASRPQCRESVSRSRQGSAPRELLRGAARPAAKASSLDRRRCRRL